jgi:hypothetical protein
LLVASYFVNVGRYMAHVLGMSLAHCFMLPNYWRSWHVAKSAAKPLVGAILKWRGMGA